MTYARIMEHRLFIPTLNKKYKIHSILNYKTGKETSVAVVVHGLTGSAYESKSRSLAKFFSARGVAVLRINLQSWLPKTRKLHRTGLYDQLSDIDAAVRWAKRRYKKIFAVGHSLGLPSLIILNPDVEGIIGWDGSGDTVFRNLASGKRDKRTSTYFADWGVRHDLGKKLYEETKNFPKKLEPLAKELHAPLCLITAGGDPWNKKANEEYFSYAPKSSEFHVVEGADHNFTAEGHEEELVKISWKFCKKIGSFSE
jgi:pimeloyl-ACP methyl ester carboxylesterase